jgi:hypothetical protein
MRNSMRLVTAVLLAFVAALLTGCGGGGSSDNATKSAMVVGVIQAAPGPVKAGGSTPMAAGDPIIVSVQELPGVSVQVAADGTFTLRGLPAGSFTLLFTQAGATIGTLTFGEVAPNQQITITVELAGTELILVDEDRRGIGDAGVEIEGPVQNVVTLNAAGDSTFVIDGRTVIARPGVTAIRKGTTRLTVSDVTVGTQVHVKGTKIEGSTDVLAYEIKIQAAETGGGGGGGSNQVTVCHIPPGNPSAKHTITIGESAWPAHQAHGDTMGPC